MSDTTPQVGTTSPKACSHRGQSLVELALVLPLILILTGGIVQVGTVIATKHTLIQIGRDLGRWAATQAPDDCIDLASGAPSSIAARADAIATESNLMGYAPSTWRTTFTSYGYGAMPAAVPGGPHVEVAWSKLSGDCPPDDSTTASFVRIRLSHEAPVLVPGLDLVLAALPSLGTDGVLLVSTTAQFRMEPQPEASP